MTISPAEKQQMIATIKVLNDEMLTTLWKTITSNTGGLTGMDTDLLRVFYDEFKKRPGLLQSITDLNNKKTRIMEMAGIRHRSDLLLEEEDDLFGDDTEDKADTEDDTDDKAEDEKEEPKADNESKTEDEIPDQLSPKEIAELGPGEIDTGLNDVLGQIFADSTKSLKAKMQSEALHRKPMSSFLFEAFDLDDFDMNKFASETARMIKHYDTVLDIEGMLFNKAKETLMQQFGDNGKTAVASFEEHMARVHGIDLTNKFAEDMIQPIAVGAGGGDGA